MKTLIVTSDDFGVATAVNDAVEQAHVEGILTCASLMVAGDAAADAVARAKRLPGLGVGDPVHAQGPPAVDLRTEPAAQLGLDRRHRRLVVARVDAVGQRGVDQRAARGGVGRCDVGEHRDVVDRAGVRVARAQNCAIES